MTKNIHGKKPRSWKEVEALPFVSHIEHEPFPDDCLGGSIFIVLKDDEPNPVTGELGSGFHVINFKDFISHYW